MTTVLPPIPTCPHCGSIHATTCPRIKAIEYHENGTVKRIELHDVWLLQPATGITPPQIDYRGYRLNVCTGVNLQNRPQ